MDALFGSERQEAQRVGRLMRPCAGKAATFYDLFTALPAPMAHLEKRKAFLARAGYEFEEEDAASVLQRTSLPPMGEEAASKLLQDTLAAEKEHAFREALKQQRAARRKARAELGLAQGAELERAPSILKQRIRKRQEAEMRKLYSGASEVRHLDGLSPCHTRFALVP